MTTTALFYRKQGFEKTQNHVLRLLFEKFTKKGKDFSKFRHTDE